VDTHATFGSAIGLLHLYGTLSLFITGLTLTVAGNHQAGNPILARSINEVFPGRLEVSGTLSGYLASFALRDAFAQEIRGNLIFFLSEAAAASANAFGVIIPRCKVGKVGSPGRRIDVRPEHPVRGPREPGRHRRRPHHDPAAGHHAVDNRPGGVGPARHPSSQRSI
jgi:hypothetical protein